MINSTSNGKDLIIHLIVRLIKKTMKEILSNSVSLYKNESILSNLSNLSNHAKIADLKNVTDVDTSNIALKTNLASLKSEVDKLDIEKLAPVPVDWSKLGDVVKNDVVQITVYDKLAANCIDTSDFVLKTKYHTGETELEKKIPDVTDFVKKTKLTELENKIPDVSSLATKTALSAVENKIPSVSSLVKKKQQIITQNLLKMKRNLLIIIMKSIFLLQNLIL